MKTPAEWKTLFESSAFARQTNYSGPLGPEYNPSGTRLRLWAPTAQSVSVNLYRRGDGGACMGSLPLEPQGQGLWSVYLPGDQHGRYYTFTVEVEGTQYETGDPYARTAGVNGLRSMILDAPRIDPPDWSHDHRPAIPASRRTVWEVSVRDFSQDPASGVRTGWRGKFMAFTQKGTTLSSAGTFPTCLDYLKRLGVGYVQLMPIFDFGSVDESRPLTRQYNWGYDPTNYNVPEGSYSTDPSKGEVRVRECKEMIAALHAAGIGVVMDVVYNHMYRNENPLNSTVPYYFFRQNPDGSFSNGSGCGNEFASERPMARKYLIDSVLYWAQEYHIDGFRFDLMGLYDVDTMNELRAALDALPGGRNILMYGEPWQGGGSQLHRYEANKANLAMLSARSSRAAVLTPGSRAMWRAGRAASGTSAARWPRGAAATGCPPTRPPRSSAMYPPTTTSPSGTSCFWCGMPGPSTPPPTRRHWPRTGWRRASISPAWGCPFCRPARSLPAPKRGWATATAPPPPSTVWTGSGRRSSTASWIITGGFWACGRGSPA